MDFSCGFGPVFSDLHHENLTYELHTDLKNHQTLLTNHYYPFERETIQPHSQRSLDLLSDSPRSRNIVLDFDNKGLQPQKVYSVLKVLNGGIRLRRAQFGY